jgi:phage/plasmid-like protein (TIGR03299 family)
VLALSGELSGSTPGRRIVREEKSMSHEVETMAYCGAVPWHGLGRAVDEAMTSEQAIALAGLDWEVEKQRLFTCTGPKAEGGRLVEVPTHKSLVRKTDSAILGVVGNVYRPVQNREVFAAMDALVTEGSMRYHTAGSLRGGKRIWLLGKIGSHETVPGDRTDQFIMAHNSHDGSSALRFLWTSIRVVCANTARVALAAGKGEGLSIRHTASATERVADVQSALGLARKAFEMEEAFSAALAEASLAHDMWASIKNLAAPLPEQKEGEEPVSVTRALKKQALLDELLANGRGQDLQIRKGVFVQDTLWGARNALTEYVNYERQTRGGQAQRFDSAMFGSGAEMVAAGDHLMAEMLDDAGIAWQ